MSRAAIAVGVNPWSASATSTASKTRVSPGVGRRSATSQKASSPKPDLAHQVGGEVLPEQADLVGGRRAERRREVQLVMRHASSSRRLRLSSQRADLVAVLVERRRRQPVVGRRLGERDRVAHRRHHRVTLADVDDRVEPDLGRRTRRRRRGVDRPARHAGGDDVAEPLVAGRRWATRAVASRLRPAAGRTSVPMPESPSARPRCQGSSAGPATGPDHAAARRCRRLAPA